MSLLHADAHICSIVKGNQLFRGCWNLLRKDALCGSFLSRKNSLQELASTQKRSGDCLLPEQCEKPYTQTASTSCISSHRRQRLQNLADLFHPRVAKQRSISDCKGKFKAVRFSAFHRGLQHTSHLLRVCSVRFHSPFYKLFCAERLDPEFLIRLLRLKGLQEPNQQSSIDDSASAQRKRRRYGFAER